MAQPLTFSLDFPFLFTEVVQSVNVSGYASIFYGLYGLCHRRYCSALDNGLIA